MRPLQDIRVLDFSTLLPGPMCTLFLAEAGADVIKIERPGTGDDMRGYAPRLGKDSINFALLNRGKKSVAADLKDPKTIEAIKRLIVDSDVIVEQFRPGVMARLGLGFDQVCQINPKIIYCSITGFGQSGPLSNVAAHDLNYQAETGMLSLSSDGHGNPFVPPTLTADLAGGAYPATLNILLALRQRDLDGKPRHLDISMADSLFALMYWGLGDGWATGHWPRPSGELVSGGSARYQVYRTADGRHLATAPLEDKFWQTFVDTIGLPELTTADPMADIKATVAARIAEKPLTHWLEAFAGKDVCVTEVKSLQSTVENPHFKARAIFERQMKTSDGMSAPALPVPIDAAFRDVRLNVESPSLGQHTREVLG